MRDEIDQNGSEIDGACSSDTLNPWFTIAAWSELLLGCLDVSVSHKRSQTASCLWKKGRKMETRGDKKERQQFL